MNTANQQTPSTCPICNSSFCCCLEHLFPDQPSFHARYKQAQAEPLHGAYKPGQAEPSHHKCKNGQAEPQVKLGPAFTELENGSLLEGVATGHASVSAPSLLPKGAAPGRTPQEGQTKRASLLEAFANILIGFWVSVLANMLVLPHFKNPGVFREAFLIGLIFTVISFVRSYLLRRLFNLFHLQGRKSLRSPWKP